MTERKWRNATDPRPMLKLLLKLFGEEASERKLRLFAAACCRSLWHLMTATDQHAVEAAEKFAEGLITSTDRDAARYVDRGSVSGRLPAASRAARSATFASGHAAAAMTEAHVTEGGLDQATQANFLRCIFGNPFRAVVFDPNWLTSTATAVARGMYESRDFAAIPILADALQDAGCDDQDILNHCRGGGAHVRGCWVVDGVLNKE